MRQWVTPRAIGFVLALFYHPGKEVGQAFQPDKAQSQAGKPDLLPWHRRSSYEPDAPARGVPQSPRWRVGLVCAKDAKLSCRGNTTRFFRAGVISPPVPSLRIHWPLATILSPLTTRHSPLAGYSHPPTARLAKIERGPISTSGPTILVWHQTARSLRKNQSVCPRSPPPNRRRRPCSRDRRRSTPVALGLPAGWPKAVVPVLSLLSLVSRYSPKQL